MNEDTTNTEKADILYKASEVFRRAVEAIIHFATEQHKSIFSPSEMYRRPRGKYK